MRVAMRKHDALRNFTHVQKLGGCRTHSEYTWGINQNIGFLFWLFLYRCRSPNLGERPNCPDCCRPVFGQPNCGQWESDDNAQGSPVSCLLILQQPICMWNNGTGKPLAVKMQSASFNQKAGTDGVDPWAILSPVKSASM